MVISRRDKIVTVVLLLIVAILLYVLQCHWKARSGSRADTKPVGEVEYKYHKVQRKFTDSMLWDDVAPKTPIYPYDWIMTQEKSDARITLKNGMKIEMDPDSMVEIALLDDKVGLQLRDGTIRADTRNAKDGVIRLADGSRIDLKDGEAHITSSASGVSVDVKEGTAVLDQGGQKTQAQAGEILQKTDTGVTKTKPTIVLKSPPQEIVLDDPTRSVDFSFEAPPGSEECRVILDLGEGKTKTISVPVGKTSSEKLSDGTYHWRATCRKGKEALTSSTGVFRIRPGSSVTLISPQANQVIAANESESLAMRWQSQGKVRVELSDNAQFSPVLEKQETTAQSIPQKNLKPGKYFWRVTPLDEQQKSVQSSFTVSEKGELLTEADKNTTKKSGKATTEKLTPVKVSAPSKVSLEPDENYAQVRFEWSPVVKSHSYYLEVSPQKDFSPLAYSAKKKGKAATGAELSPGIYYYRVLSQAPHATKRTSSAVGRITITKKPLPEPPRVKSVESE